LQSSIDANNEDCEEINREFSNIYMGSNNNTNSAGPKKEEDNKKGSASVESKNSSKKDIYKTLREILKG